MEPAHSLTRGWVRHLASGYDQYKESRRLFNQALKASYSSRMERVQVDAMRRLERMLDTVPDKSI